jgi:hypothetical protein
MADSQFEAGRLDNYKRDYFKRGYSWSDDSYSRSKFQYSNSTETSENSDGYVFNIPLSEISIENLKIIPTKTYLIVQSNKKTIFITLDHEIKPESISTALNGDKLIIGVKK